MLERKQTYAQSQKVAQLFYFQSQSAFDAKQSSISGGGDGTQSQGRCLPTAWPLLSPGSVKLYHSHPEGRPPSQRGSTHGSLPACAVQTLLGHSLDLGDGKSS